MVYIIVLWSGLCRKRCFTVFRAVEVVVGRFMFNVFMPGCSKGELLKTFIKGENVTSARIRVMIVIRSIIAVSISKEFLFEESLEGCSYVGVCGGWGWVVVGVVIGVRGGCGGVCFVVGFPQL